MIANTNVLSQRTRADCFRHPCIYAKVLYLTLFYNDFSSDLEARTMFFFFTQFVIADQESNIFFFYMEPFWQYWQVTVREKSFFPVNQHCNKLTFRCERIIANRKFSCAKTRKLRSSIYGISMISQPDTRCRKSNTCEKIGDTPSATSFAKRSWIASLSSTAENDSGRPVLLVFSAEILPSICAYHFVRKKKKIIGNLKHHCCNLAEQKTLKQDVEISVKVRELREKYPRNLWIDLIFQRLKRSPLSECQKKVIPLAILVELALGGARDSVNSFLLLYGPRVNRYFSDFHLALSRVWLHSIEKEGEFRDQRPRKNWFEL